MLPLSSQTSGRSFPLWNFRQDHEGIIFLLISKANEKKRERICHFVKDNFSHKEKGRLNYPLTFRDGYFKVYVRSGKNIFHSVSTLLCTSQGQHNLISDNLSLASFSRKHNSVKQQQINYCMKCINLKEYTIKLSETSWRQVRTSRWKTAGANRLVEEHEMGVVVGLLAMER